MISKNFTKYFQIPLYWLTLLVFFFLVSSLIPMLTGYFVSLLTSGTDKHEVFRIFGPNFPRLMSFLSSLAFSIALSLFLWSKILRPIGSISLAAKQVADGDFSVHVPNSKSFRSDSMLFNSCTIRLKLSVSSQIASKDFEFGT